MNELALALFAAAGDGHATDRDRRTKRFAHFLESFEETVWLRRLAEEGFGWLGRSDPAFPPGLRSLHDPPPGLFLRGSSVSDLLHRPAVAVVGARACSDYGAHVARSLGRELGGAGVVVLSGLARGVDAWAHRGCLEAGGITVAVLGCGIDRDYPLAHASLAGEIAERGLLVSEYPPGVAPAAWRFPARNRLVAGLALATVVVEACEGSGALITADLALEEGREVLAVPVRSPRRCRTARTRSCASERHRSPVRTTFSRRSASSPRSPPPERLPPGSAAAGGLHGPRGRRDHGR